MWKLYKSSIYLLLVTLLGITTAASGQHIFTDYADQKNSNIAVQTVSQQLLEMKISLKVKNMPVQQVLKKLQKLSDTQIVYTEDILADKPHVTLHAEEQKLFDVLDLISNQTGLKYWATGSFIIMRGSELPEQMETVSGQVTDAATGEPLPGVNVVVKGTTTGTSTDSEGSYELNVPSLQDTLVFSFIGYQPQEVPINGRTSINVELQTQAISGEELVVVGYGTQRRENVTGSVSQITSEDLDAIPLGRMDDAFAGQFTGVNVRQTNPAAGEAPVIKVRGQGSLSFESDPLVVVDGIAVGNGTDFLANMNMDNVQSVEVLKDASSAAIYGSRGANGVILVTTKEGQRGSPTLTYNSYMGFKSVPDRHILRSPDEWAEYVRANNNGQLDDRNRYVQEIGNYTDWERVVFDGGAIMNHSLSASGGNDNTSYLVSLNYLNEDGVMVKNNFEKYNLRINIDTQVRDRLDFGLRLNPSRTITTAFPINVHDALRDGTWAPLYVTEDNIQFVNRIRSNGRFADTQVGDYAMERMFDNYDLEAGQPVAPPNGITISETSGQSNWGEIQETDEKSYQTSIFGNTYLTYSLLDNLDLKQTVGFDYQESRTTVFEGIIESFEIDGGTEQELGRSSSLHYVAETTLNYSNDFQAHTVNAVAGFGFEEWDSESAVIEAEGGRTNLVTTIGEADLAGGSSFESEERLMSFFSRINYDYDDKYLLSLSARVDGSSKFGPNNKYGLFRAGSAGWNISQEPFFENVSVINDLKLRISYGETGNNNGIGRYEHQSLLALVGTGFGQTGFNVQNLGNPSLEWEKLIEINPGIDISLLSNTINLSFDYYKRTSEDLLLELAVPAVTGFQSELVNRGVVENEGVEFQLNTTNISNSNFSWITSALLTHNKNTLTDFAGIGEEISTIDPKRPAEWIAREGLPIATFYGYKMADREIDPQYIVDPFWPIDGESKDIYVQDLNGDGVITNADKTILGSPYPDFTWSLRNSFRYKNVTLSFMWNGSHGAQVMNMQRQYLETHFSPNKDFTADFPDKDLVRERIFTDDIVQSADYITLRNLKVSYNLPNSILNNLGMQSGRLYASGTNLVYIMADDYEGYNPEGISDFSSPLTYGYVRSAAPIHSTYTIGINFEF